MDTTVRVVRRYLLIISRPHIWLYRDLSKCFSGDARFDMILDRRREERRQGGVWSGPERRRGDRRMRPDIDAELRQRSNAMVIFDDEA